MKKRYLAVCLLLIMSFSMAACSNGSKDGAATYSVWSDKGGYSATVHGTVIARSKGSIVVENKYPTSKYPTDDPESDWTDDYYVFKYGDSIADIRDANDQLIGFSDIKVGDRIDVMWKPDSETSSNNAPIPWRINLVSEDQS